VGTHREPQERHQDLQVHQRQQSQAQGDPYLTLARKVLAIPDAESIMVMQDF
jgi:hypothetical protein